MYKTKLIGETEAQPAPNNNNGIIKHATIPVLLKNIWLIFESLEMPLINCKTELKYKWSKHFVLAAADSNNTGGNPNNIIFTIKDTGLYSSAVTSSEKENQKLSKVLGKGFEISAFWNKYKKRW